MKVYIRPFGEHGAPFWYISDAANWTTDLGSNPMPQHLWKDGGWQNSTGWAGAGPTSDNGVYADNKEAVAVAKKKGYKYIIQAKPDEKG